MYEVALEILNIFDDNNFEAYIVGGYVRDKLLCIESSDIDIITNAKLSEISKIFNINIQSNYASINFEYKGFKYDLTTFREDLNYLDSRRPSMIKYVDTLREDLMRRDFTINTICIDKDGNYIDLFDGINDLNNKILRSVSNPVEKLKEDSLRILRAIRFSSIYNLTIDDDLYSAMKLNSYLVGNLSYDRIKKELDIIFNTNNCNLALNIINDLNLYEILQIKPKNSVICTNDYLSIWAQLDCSSNYNFSNKEKKVINEIKYILNIGYIDEYILYKFNINNVKQASLILNINDDIDDMYNKLIIQSRKDIDITYEDIINLKLNTNINNIYIDLEKQILYNKLKNKKQDIICYILNKYKVGDYIE